MPTIVTTEMDLKLVLTAERSVSVLALLDYAAHEPYSVRATFRTSEGDVNWVFARDLIAEGLRKPAGDGDIAMWPSKTDGRDVLCISLSSPSGQALMEAPRDVIDEFMARSYNVVPAGSESSLIDMDSLIDRLLEEG
ncbi:MAG: SsgA family sporulation/cell division regulator [Actinobacteria bacterium]|nr:SsgA family sporulation/cell division regulator [Actinomycetota bacterium]